MEPENTPLQKENHRIQTIIFRFELLIFGGVHIILQLEVPFILKPSQWMGCLALPFFAITNHIQASVWQKSP